MIALSVSETLAASIGEVEAAALPPRVREVAADLVLDVAGLCIAARDTDYVRATLAATTGTGRATAIGHRSEHDCAASALINGTAAHGAYVSASVIGEWYYWWGANSTAVMYGSTDGSGVAHLVVPSAPAIVSAWDWVPVNVSQSQVPVPITVGGEKMNVTAIWARTYVGLAATGLLFPPEKDISLSLRQQQSEFWAEPQGGSISSQGGAAVSNINAGVPSQTQQASSGSYYLPSVIPSLQMSAGASKAPGATADAFLGIGPLSAAVAAAAALVGFGLAAVVLRGRKAREPV
jgi:hypothetical protein